MNEAKLGLLKSVARDAAMVLGVVMTLTTLGASAQAETAPEAAEANNQTSPQIETRPVPVRVLFNDSQNQSSGPATARAPVNDPEAQDEVRRAQAGGPNHAGEVRCLAEAIYYESRGEPVRGQQAVAEVVANRVRSRAYPNTYCGVVYQRSRNVCQFSWACDSRRAPPRGLQWQRAQEIAERVHEGWEPRVAPGATHFHATYVRPGWASRLPRVGQIGTHVFYRLR